MCETTKLKKDWRSISWCHTASILWE